MDNAYQNDAFLMIYSNISKARIGRKGRIYFMVFIATTVQNFKFPAQVQINLGSG